MFVVGLGYFRYNHVPRFTLKLKAIKAEAMYLMPELNTSSFLIGQPC